MANEDLVSYTTVSITAAKLEMAQKLPVTFNPDMLTTLNAKYNVLPTVSPTVIPKIRYFGIGTMGKYNADDMNGSSAYKPKMAEMDLYNPIPFRVVPVDEDLSAQERVKYRMRTRKTIKGSEYFCYWLKLIEFPTGIELVRINPKTHEEEPYELDPTNLNPTPSKPSASGTTEGTVQEIKAQVKGLVTITGAEVVEAVKVFYGDLRYAVVSELALYSGEDKDVTGTTEAGTSFAYVESIYTQLQVKQTNLGIPMTNTESVDRRNVIFSSGSTMAKIMN